MTEVERNKKLVQDFVSACNKGDTQAVVAMFAPDCRHVVAGTTAISGTYSWEQMTAGVGGIFAPFPKGLAFELVGLIAEGDKVAFEVRSRGVHASGKLYANEYHWVMRLRDGQIVESKEYADTQLIKEVLCGGMPAAEGTT